MLKRLLSGTLLSRILLHCVTFAAQSQPTEYEKVEKMLELLERRDDDLIDAFKDALVATDQKYIVDKFLQPSKCCIGVRGGCDIDKNRLQINQLISDNRK